MVRSSRHQQLSALYRVRVISHTEGSIAVMRCFFSCQQGGKQMKKFYRRSISGLLALLICFTTILGSSVTALATSVPAETAKTYSVAFPRDGDANLDTSGTWGHDELHYMNGWTSGEKTWMTTLHTIGLLLHRTGGTPSAGKNLRSLRRRLLEGLSLRVQQHHRR